MIKKANRLHTKSLGGPNPHNPMFSSGASGLVQCGSVAAFRAATPLPDEAQRMIDDAVVRVGRNRLQLVDDLISEGLTFPLENWLAVPELYWEKVSEVGHAQRTMQPKSRGERQVQDRLPARLPIYATWDDFSFGIRELLAAARAGAPLDMTHVEQGTRRVNEGIEDAGIYGAGITVTGNSTPGILTETNVNTQQYTGSNKAWDHSSKTGKEIITDVLNMIGKNQADGYYGPYNLYVNTDYDLALNNDYSDGVTTFDQTIRERIEKIQAGGRNIRVRVADMLDPGGDKTALVQMTTNVIDVVIGQTPVPVSWSDGPGWERYFVILASIVPRVKSDYNGGSGICIGDVT